MDHTSIRASGAPSNDPLWGAAQLDISQFASQGYLVLRGLLEGVGLLARVQQEVVELGRLFVPDFALHDESYRSFSPADQSRFYNGLRYLPSLAALASSPGLTAISRQLGLRMPAVMHSYNIRMDVPQDERVLFHWHQDISYLLGSLNSITYWIPLGRTDSHHGSIEVLPGSHGAGLAPVRYTSEGIPPAGKYLSPKDLVLVEEPSQPCPTVEAELGDVVVFSQFLIHRSTANRSRQVRWTIQVRHSDLAEKEFIAAGYPLGDRTNLFHTTYLGEGSRR